MVFDYFDAPVFFFLTSPASSMAFSLFKSSNSTYWVSLTSVCCFCPVLACSTVPFSSFFISTSIAALFSAFGSACSFELAPDFEAVFWAFLRALVAEPGGV